MVDSHLLPDLQRTPQVDSWIERLPAPLRAAWRESWAYRTAKHRVAKGLSVGHAIASAIEDCKKGTVGGHPIHDPKALAEQKAALVVWESMKAWNKAHHAKSAAKNTSERKTAAILLATKLESSGYSREDAARRGVELSARVVSGLDLADWTPDLHSRDPIGRFRAKWGAIFNAATDADKKRLSIPPAWKGVHVSRDPGGPLLAVGLDAKGREQRIYSAAHHEKQAAAKFARINELHARHPKIDKQIATDAKTNDTALAALLISRMGLRPGSDANTGAEKKAHGATNLQVGHVKTSEAGGKVHLNFTGKKGVALDLKHHDPELARLLKGRQKGKGGTDRLLNTDDRKLRAYMAQVAPGVKPKDLRTHLATKKAALLVASMPLPKTAGEYRKQRRQVGQQVSEILGNTPTMALGSYIAPSVFAPWDAVE